MSKEDFIMLMNEQSRQLNIQKELKENKEMLERKKSGLKNTNAKQPSKILNQEENEEYLEDDEDQKINEEFKGVIRSVRKRII